MACSDLRGKWRRGSCPKTDATPNSFYEVENPGWKGRNERGTRWDAKGIPVLFHRSSTPRVLVFSTELRKRNNGLVSYRMGG